MEDQMIRAIALSLALLPLPALAVCDTYPCAHVAHVATGAIIGYAMTKYEAKPSTIIVTVLLLAIARESYDASHGKTFNNKDVVGRVAGAPIGIYFAKEF